MKKIIKTLKTPEKSGKKIGFFRIICSIVGGLLLSYLGMTLLVYIIPAKPGESIVIPLILNTIVWAITALWISLSYNKLNAILKVLIPSLIFLILIIAFYNT